MEPPAIVVPIAPFGPPKSSEAADEVTPADDPGIETPLPPEPSTDVAESSPVPPVAESSSPDQASPKESQALVPEGPPEEPPELTTTTPPVSASTAGTSDLPAAEAAPEVAGETSVTAVAPEPEPEPEVVAALAPESAATQQTPLAPDDAAGAPEEAAPAAAEEPDREVEPAVTTPLTWIAHARPYDQRDERPRIAIVITSLGLSEGATTAAIELPGGVTLAFASYAQKLQEWINLARAAGHEVMLDLPMEPNNYPSLDPGPQPLLTSISLDENNSRLQWHLGRATGYVGVTNNMGSRFTSSAPVFKPVMASLNLRGLLYLDSRTSSGPVARTIAADLGIPHVVNDRFLDDKASRTEIDKRLAEIERIARQSGVAVALCHAFPITLERLAAWIPTLAAKGLALAPVSAVVKQVERG